MLCYRIIEGKVVRGIPVEEGRVRVGHATRHSSPVDVPLPDGAKVVEGVLEGIPGMTSVLVLFHSQHGYRGTWSLHGARSKTDWDRKVRGQEVPPRTPHGLEIVAEGYASDSELGALGHGPEYLAVMKHGQAVEIVREGRLYSAPAVVRLENVAGLLVRSMPRKEAEERWAAEKLAAVTGDETAVAADLGWGGGGTNRLHAEEMAKRPFLEKDGKEYVFQGESIPGVCEVLNYIGNRTGRMCTRNERWEVALYPGVTYMGNKPLEEPPVQAAVQGPTLAGILEKEG